MSVKQFIDIVGLVGAVVLMALAIVVEARGGNGFELFCTSMLLSIHIQVSKIHERNKVE